MKKLLALLLAVTMAFSLAACGENDTGGGGLPPPQSSVDSSTLSTDFQQYMKTTDCTKICGGCETETGWYFQYDAFLYYIDKKTMKTTIVCGKPDCKHTNSACNAWVNTNSLNFYGGKLYFDNADLDITRSGLLTLFSMDIDGSNHKEVQELQQQKQNDWKPCAAVIHRGSIYFNYAGAIYTAPLGTDMSKASKLYGEVKNAVAGVDTDDGLNWKICADNDKVYFMGNIVQSDKTQKDTLFCYDTNTKEFKQVWQVPDGSEVGKWETTGVSLIQTGKPSCGWYIKDGVLYFYLSGNDLWRNDLNGGKNERVATVSEKVPESGFAIFNNDNIFIINDYPQYMDTLTDEEMTEANTIFVYDYEGSMLKKLPIENLSKEFNSVSNIQMLWAREGKLFLYVYGDTKVSQIGANSQTASSKERMAYIDIESGVLSFIEGWTGSDGR